MKTIRLLLLCCTISLTAFCQMQTEEQFYKNKVFVGDGFVDTTHATPEQMVKVRLMQKARALSKDHYYYDFPNLMNIGVRFVSSEGPKSEIYEGSNWGEGNYFKSILIVGNCGVEFSALDVTEKNANDYRYHVVQNDSEELVTWTKPSVFKTTKDGKLKYAYLGKFDYVAGQVLKVEIYNIKNYRQYDAMLIDWRKVEAANVLSDIQYLSHDFPLPDNGLISRPITDTVHTKKMHQEIVNNKLITTWLPYTNKKDFIETTAADKNNIKIRLGDSLQQIQFIILNGKRMFDYKVNLVRDIDGHKNNLTLGETNSRFNLSKEFWKYPGKYQITFTPKIHKHGGNPVFVLNKLARTISFTVLPALDTEHSIPVKTVEYIILIILTTGAYMFVVYRKGQKRKLAKEAQNKQIAALQLQSVRAQLNPHFIFNALAGIQNLMNKNATEDANRYLTRFARLTRNVLDDGQKELTTIEHEAALLNDYLQMEQLRFRFKFNINTNDVDQQIEIPAMLLQPFVENAVKHGVSALKEQGMITIDIIQHENNVTLSVADNGKGFSEEKTVGLGIKLCEERIRLLNSIYKNINIVLNKKSDDNGTQITIELNNWLQ